MAGFKDTCSLLISNAAFATRRSNSKTKTRRSVGYGRNYESTGTSSKIEVDTETDRMKVDMNDDLERDILSSTKLRMAELYGKYGQNAVNLDEVRQILEQNNDELRAMQKAEAQGCLKMRKLKNFII